MSACVRLGIGVLAMYWLTGCQSTRQRLLDTDVNPVALRSMQTRAFETTDRHAALRAVIATLQDLDFVIDEADPALGSVSATKLAVYELRMTVTVRPRGEDQLLVRANAQFRRKPIREPEHYQRFFVSLAKAMFLDAQQVE